MSYYLASLLQGFCFCSRAFRQVPTVDYADFLEIRTQIDAQIVSFQMSTYSMLKAQFHGTGVNLSFSTSSTSSSVPEFRRTITRNNSPSSSHNVFGLTSLLICCKGIKHWRCLLTAHLAYSRPSRKLGIQDSIRPPPEDSLCLLGGSAPD